MKLLDIIKRELDPRHDFDRVGYIHPKYLQALLKDKSFLKALGHTYYFNVNIIKHAIRGGAVGAGLGVLGFYFTGKNPGMGVIELGVIGACIDITQYYTRGVAIPTIIDTYEDIKRACIEIRNSLKKPSNGEFLN